MINNDYIKTEVPGLVVDRRSGAIINVDNAKLEEYRKLRKHHETMQNTLTRIDNLEKDMGEIKDLLKLIASKVV